MIAVIFEVWPSREGKEAYLETASRLRSELEGVEGFRSVERFQSLTDPEKLLSLSFWRDESAVAAWRNLDSHRKAQRLGRNGVFADYRLRVAQVLRDYGLDRNRDQAPFDSQNAHGA